MSNRLLQGFILVCLICASGASLLAQAKFHENNRRWDRRGPQIERWLSIEAAILQEVNNLRATRGLSRLRPHSLLSEIARRHSHDMIERNYFDHITPELHSPHERVRHRMGHVISDLAENLWMRLGALPHETPEETAQAIVADWLSSPGHRDNLLEPHFSHLGVGFYGSDDGLRLRATQLFALMSRAVEAVALQQP